MAYSPPFCPNSNCIYHIKAPGDITWCYKKGFFYSDIHGKTQRFLCRACSQTFSTQTFALSYRTKRKVNLRRIFFSLISASGIRDMAREQNVSVKVIINRIQRLARQAMGMIAALRKDYSIKEDMAVDGFESFVHSKYFPNNYTLAVGKKSQFLYDVDFAQIRRKGKMTAFQRKKAKELYRKYPIETGQIRQSFGRIINTLMEFWDFSEDKASRTPKVLHTDEHKSYGTEIKYNKKWQSLMEQGLVIHKTTSSKAPRTLSNPLMSVNYFDREIRKDQANHARKTLQWSKSVNNSMDRMLVYGACHNWWKPYRINSDKKNVHGEKAGFERKKIEVQKKRFFSKRYFAAENSLTASEWRTWYRLWKSPVTEDRLRLPGFAM